MIISKSRDTTETKVKLELGYNEDKESIIDTGVGFFDHMLELLAFHSGLYINVHVDGDLHVDAHHTVEDVGILLGEALRDIYKELKSYTRYGHFYLPMDEALVRVVLDLSGRPHIQFRSELSSKRVGDFDTELVEEFFTALAMNSRITLHIELLYGKNTHHEIEAMFKGFGRALRIALSPSDGGVPSTKGLIQ